MEAAMLRLATLALCLLLLPGPGRPQDAAPPDLSGEPATAGLYHLSPGEARLLFRYKHLGFSNYTALILDFGADLEFDPDAPERMSVRAWADPASVETHYPEEFDFNGFITGPDLLDVATYPEAGFVSTSVKLTGERRADVTGDLTLHGVTRPVVFDVTFNGGYGGHPLDAGARIGFSATATFNRSDFGITFGLPPEGSNRGVFDPVELILEAEFVKPREG
jgi:polyisoprenoid-binding protein YceI